MRPEEYKSELIKLRSSMEHVINDLDNRLLLMNDPAKGFRANGLNNVVNSLVKLELIHVGSCMYNSNDTSDVPTISVSSIRVQAELDKKFLEHWDVCFPDDIHNPDVGITDSMRANMAYYDYIEQHNVVPVFV